jgi:hypothetical protein
MILGLSRLARPTTTATPTVPTIIATEITRHTTILALAPPPTLPRMATSTRSEVMGAGKTQWMLADDMLWKIHSPYSSRMICLGDR